MVRLIWSANSLVGAKTSALGVPGILGTEPMVANLLIRGAPKAMVLPLPVFPRPKMSLPFIAAGMVASWMGNGTLAPILASSVTILSCRPIDWKVSCDSTASVVEVRRLKTLSPSKVFPVELFLRALSKAWSLERSRLSRCLWISFERGLKPSLERGLKPSFDLGF